MPLDDPSSPHLVLTDDASAEAQTLLGLWNERWPDIVPWRHLPRESRPDDWVRFHTLPEGRRTPRHRRDRRTAARRFRRVVRTVEEITAMPATVLLVEDPRWPGERTDRVASVVPTAQPWVTHIVDDDEDDDFDTDDDNEDEDKDDDSYADDDNEDEDDDGHEEHDDQDEDDDDVWPDERHSFRSGPVDDHLLTALTLLVHRSDVDFLLLPTDLSWVVSAYDGGVDAVVRSPEEAAVLAGRLRRWLPPAGWQGALSWTRPATQRELRRGSEY